MIKKITTTFLILASFFFANSQKTITNYYGWSKNIKEQYQVNQQGVKNGFFKFYSEKGVLVCSYNFLSGLRNGPCIDYCDGCMFSENGEFQGALSPTSCYGKPLKEALYKSGKVVWEKKYKCNNYTNYIVSKTEQTIDKKWKYTNYYEDGKISEVYYVAEYGSTKPFEGEYLSFFNNGKIHEKGKYDAGELNGTWNIHYSDKTEATYNMTFYKGVVMKSENKYQTILTDSLFTTCTVTYFDSSLNMTRKVIKKSYPFVKNKYMHNDDVNSWRDCIGLKINGYNYTPFAERKSYYNEFDISYENGKPVDTLARYLIKDIKAENDEPYMPYSSLSSDELKEKMVNYENLKRRIDEYYIDEKVFPMDTASYSLFFTKNQYKSYPQVKWIDELYTNFSNYYLNKIKEVYLEYSGTTSLMHKDILVIKMKDFYQSFKQVKKSFEYRCRDFQHMEFASDEQKRKAIETENLVKASSSIVEKLKAFGLEKQMFE